MLACCCVPDDKAATAELVTNTGEDLISPPIEEAQDALPAGMEPKEELAPPAEPADTGAAAPAAAAATGLDFAFIVGAEEKTITFTAKPIGMQFDKKLPIVIASFTPDSKAKELGVEVGWQMKSVGGEDVTGCKSYEDALAIIKKKLETLP
mmetsp:Transcript_82232/g.156265  ORF Transcript_82232/g.156265 Transcript_82232/m.156265 type:complete len:151 (-) Transcript_82232:84-536(-)